MTQNSQAGEAAPRGEVLESFQDLLERLDLERVDAEEALDHCPLLRPEWLRSLEGIGWEGDLEEMRTTRTPG